MNTWYIIFVVNIDKLDISVLNLAKYLRDLKKYKNCHDYNNKKDEFKEYVNKILMENDNDWKRIYTNKGNQ